MKVTHHGETERALREARRNYDKARATMRRLAVEAQSDGWHPTDVAEALGVSERTVRRWRPTKPDNPQPPPVPRPRGGGRFRTPLTVDRLVRDRVKNYRRIPVVKAEQ